MRKRVLILLLISTVPVFFNSAQDARSTDWQTLNEDLLIRASDFEVQERSGLAIVASGLALADSANSGSYTSPPIQAPIPFNAVVPQWLVDLPHSSGMKFHLRSGSSVSEWDSWREIHPSYDWMLPEDEEIVGEMSFVPAADNTHTYVQFMITLNRDDKLAEPLLRELRLTFIDSTAGPTVDQLVELQKSMNQREATDRATIETSPEGYPKPFVISRAAWCTDSLCNYSDGLEYQPVTHLILHHTANYPNGDSAAQLRAIWSYHTFTRDWGDIGYNFVIDLEGIIFEGHLGGDDVVGTHAAKANTGSMGVAMIGTYLDSEPSAAIQESIIDMFAWKADQRDIDVFDATDTLPNVEYGLPHIMGHSDVSGTTECPGGAAHNLIPAIRDEVADRIGLESPYIYVDELSTNFIKSDAYWIVADSQCGYDNHAWYTWSVTDVAEAINWGEWRPDVPLSGRYRIEAYIPYCYTQRDETAGAHYTVKHAEGSSSVVISHQANVGLWASLGDYNLQAGNGNVIHLTDLTTTDDGLGVWFDALRLLPLKGPTAVTTAPNDGDWLNNRQVLFEWRIESPEKVTRTTFQVASDERFQNLVATKEWPSVVENVTHTFDRDYARLFWRVVLRSESGGEYPSASSRFGIDTEPPVSLVNSLAWLAWNGRYRASWSGSDTFSDVGSYSIEYRAPDGQDSSWQPWLNAVTVTSAYFAPPVPGQIYEFRSQATDSLGNIEAPHATADVSTEQAHSFSHAIILPLIRNK
jgi:hypothetical protein